MSPNSSILHYLLKKEYQRQEGHTLNHPPDTCSVGPRLFYVPGLSRLTLGTPSLGLPALRFLSSSLYCLWNARCLPSALAGVWLPPLQCLIGLTACPELILRFGLGTFPTLSHFSTCGAEASSFVVSSASCLLSFFMPLLAGVFICEGHSHPRLGSSFSLGFVLSGVILYSALSSLVMLTLPTHNYLELFASCGAPFWNVPWEQGTGYLLGKHDW